MIGNQDLAGRLGGVDRRLYGFAAILAALLTFAGFARTYYVKFAFGTPELRTLLHLHGVIMTLWFVLFAVQVRLVATHRVRLHRRLGLFSLILTVAMVGVGAATAISAARLGHSPGPPATVFLMIPLSILFVFSIYYGLALYYRKRPDFHKRLMLLASLSMLSPALARLPLLRGAGVVAILASGILICLGCVAFDTLRNRRLHPAFAWGAGSLVLSLPLRILVANTAAWKQFAEWLIKA